MTQQRAPEWKQRMRAESQRCLAKLRELQQRGVKGSDTPPVYKPHPQGWRGGNGTYHCPVCDALTHFDGDPHGYFTHVCSSGTCDWYSMKYVDY